MADQRASGGSGASPGSRLVTQDLGRLGIEALAVTVERREVPRIARGPPAAEEKPAEHPLDHGRAGAGWPRQLVEGGNDRDPGRASRGPQTGRECPAGG